ncbi:hypothetical protein ACSBR2_036557 [Camellia fascicularis]
MKIWDMVEWSKHEIESTDWAYSTKKLGSWTAEEDQKLSQAIETYGAKRWESIAVKAGFSRCGKSCRLRWLNYLRPNIKRGNIPDQEKDLILRLHKLLGNRWSLIAGRLPGRTDNEIKNYWNSHLSKKLRLQSKRKISKTTQAYKKLQKTKEIKTEKVAGIVKDEGTSKIDENSKINLIENGDALFDCFEEGPPSLEWMREFLEVDEGCYI